jgi:2-keto-myo-inositol isomerase
MLTKNRFALNRIISPSMTFAEFVKFTAGLGLSKIEIRNDLPGKPEVEDIVDGLKPAEARSIARGEGVSIISINALQKFNLPSRRKDRLEELKKMLELSAAIDCGAVVLCPNNEKDDTRSPKQKYRDTVDALAEYGPLFVEYGIAGFVETLGFGISSLASIPVAIATIKASGYGCYRVLLDSFHHYIGPDDRSIFGMDGLGAPYEIPYTGLVHISGVEDDIPVDQFLDAHRVLTGNRDKMGNKELIRCLDNLGYLGTFSFEPFGKAVQDLPPGELASGIETSLDYLGAKAGNN